MQPRFGARRAAYVAAMAALLIVSKEAVSALPNIEPVSLLTALFAVYFGMDSLAAVYIFVVAEGLLYGFSPWWWVPYLYIWALLWLAARLMRRTGQPLAWAALLGLFGLAFGFLCSLPYFAVGDWAGGVAYFVAGLGYDLLHAGGNFLLALLLWKPLSRALARITGTDPQAG